MVDPLLSGGFKPLLDGTLCFPCGRLDAVVVACWFDDMLPVLDVLRQLDPLDPIEDAPSTGFVGDVLGDPDRGHPGAGIFLKLDLVESPLELERAVGLLSPAVPFRLGF